MLMVIDKSLDSKESCVMCYYILQKIKQTLDADIQCPDLLHSFSVKERQRQWKPDPTFFSKCKTHN